MSSKYEYLFGPVASRRLGRSLGVDIVPLKTCSQNCVYCQLGRHGAATLERRAYVPAAEVLAELQRRIEEGLEADYITVSGSGEPTLNSELGVLIDGIHELTDIPAAVITNGTLLWDPAVRAECGRADVVLPSLDAGDEETFRIVNKPAEGLRFDEFVEGLATFRQEYAGPIWLEVFVIEGVNTDEGQISKIARLIERIQPERIHLNTAVRPTAEAGVRAATREHLEEIARRLGEKAEVVAEFSKGAGAARAGSEAEAVLEMVRRRPCNLADVRTGLGVSEYAAQAVLMGLLRKGFVEVEVREGCSYYKARE